MEGTIIARLSQISCKSVKNCHWINSGGRGGGGEGAFTLQIFTLVLIG